jgi:hypothetical protein
MTLNFSKNEDKVSFYFFVVLIWKFFKIQEV